LKLVSYKKDTCSERNELYMTMTNLCKLLHVVGNPTIIEQKKK